MNAIDSEIVLQLCNEYGQDIALEVIASMVDSGLLSLETLNEMVMLKNSNIAYEAANAAAKSKGVPYFGHDRYF